MPATDVCPIGRADGMMTRFCIRQRHAGAFHWRLMHAPKDVQLIGNEVAVIWDDGVESYFPFEKLRAASPSASNLGERDILGNQYGGNGPKRFPGVQVVGWERVGNYALRFDFSDGHNSGLYSFDYLRQLAERL